MVIAENLRHITKMENRRALTRGRPKDVKKEGKKGSLRPSPIRRSSPLRKRSPPGGRKSPSRRVSPGRKSSRPPSTTNKRSSGQRSAVVITQTSVNAITLTKNIKDSTTFSTLQPKDVTTTDPVTNKKREGSGNTATNTSSVRSSFSIETQKTTDIGSNRNISGQSEEAKITDFIRRSVSKALSSLQREGSQTPSTHRSQASRSISQSVYDDGDNYSKMEFSDSEEENFQSVNITKKTYQTPLLDKSSSICRKLEIPKEFGGTLGISVLMFLLSFLTYYTSWCCENTDCELKKPNVQALSNLNYLLKQFNKQALGSFIGFNCAVFVMSAFPFGRFVCLPNDRIGSRHHFNAFPIAILVTMSFALLELYLKYQVSEFILKHYLRYCLYSLLSALFISLWCYARANSNSGNDLQVNSYAKSGNFFVDFCLGRHINPKFFGKIDVKQFYYKVSLIFCLLLAEIFICKNIHLQASFEPVMDSANWMKSLSHLANFYLQNLIFDITSLVSSLMLLIYVLDIIFFEHHLASSFELQQEGVGALLLFRYSALPFILNAIPKFIFKHKPVELSNWALITMVVLFICGVALKRISNRIKYKYRLNPNLPAFANIETVHTFQGRRLLLGNYWGRVRQPNYAGEILIFLSFTVPLYFKFAWPLLVSCILPIVFLLHRAVRVNARNLTRYHSSWVRYCMKVKYLVLPKVF